MTLSIDRMVGQSWQRQLSVGMLPAPIMLLWANRYREQRALNTAYYKWTLVEDLRALTKSHRLSAYPKAQLQTSAVTYSPIQSGLTLKKRWLRVVEWGSTTSHIQSTMPWLMAKASRFTPSRVSIWTVEALMDLCEPVNTLQN